MKDGDVDRIWRAFHKAERKLFDYSRIQIISATVMDWRRGEASC